MTPPRRIARQIAVEQREVDAKIAAGATYAIAGGGSRNVVHVYNCPVMRPLLDLAVRYERSGFDPEQHRPTRPDGRMSWTVPRLMTREEVEQLLEYRPGKCCSPSLDHARKDERRLPRRGWVRSSVRTAVVEARSQRVPKMVGRRVELIEGEPIGTLSSIELTMAAAGAAVRLVMDDESTHSVELTTPIFYEQQPVDGGAA